MLPNIHKRIMNREINELQTKYKSIQIHITHPNQFNIFLYDPFEDLLPKTLEFSIPKEYPFVPPQIFTRLNNKTPEDAPQEVQRQQTKDKIPYIKTIHCCEIPSVIKKLKIYYDKNYLVFKISSKKKFEDEEIKYFTYVENFLKSYLLENLHREKKFYTNLYNLQTIEINFAILNSEINKLDYQRESITRDIKYTYIKNIFGIFNSIFIFIVFILYNKRQ